MLELRNELDALEARLTQARELVAASLEQVASLRGRIDEIDTLGAHDDARESLEAIQRLDGEQQQTLHEVRARGQGSGLRKAVDEAAALDGEQIRLVEEAKANGRDNPKVASALERHRELGKEQQSKLSAEIGKFEAQGLRGLLEQFRSLGEQHEQIVKQLLSRP